MSRVPALWLPLWCPRNTGPISGAWRDYRKEEEEIFGEKEAEKYKVGVARYIKDTNRQLLWGELLSSKMIINRN